MKEIHDILVAYDGIDKNTTKLALATVINVKGSSYRRIGARMLIQDNGLWVGGISGGCIEGNALQKANLAMSENKAIKVTYDTSLENEEQIGVSLGCNGVIEVLITPIHPDDNKNPVEQLREVTKSREPKVLLTVVDSAASDITSGSAYLAHPKSALDKLIDYVHPESLSTAINRVSSRKKSELISLNQIELLIEYIPPSTQLVIMGSNYDVYPLIVAAKILDWRVVVVSRTNRLDNKIIALADEICQNLEKIKVDKYTAAVLMSHDYNADLKYLRLCLDSQLQYIGVLGPAKRKTEMLTELSDMITNDDGERIFGPVGLDIGAIQPEEIAVSIIAEIIATMRDRNGGALRLRQEPIHQRD